MTQAKVILQCPACKQGLRVPADLGTLRVKCPMCNTRWDWTPPPSAELDAAPSPPSDQRRGVRNGLPDPPRKPLPNDKISRNDPCPCGSGRKFKRCCLLKKNNRFHIG